MRIKNSCFKRIIFPLIIAIFIFISCSYENRETKGDSGNTNIFKNPVFRIIAQYQDTRNTDSLLPYLRNKNNSVRALAVRAFASVQDTTVITQLAKLLSDKSVRVRMNTAFALGQTRHSLAEDFLIKIIEKEESDSVKSEIFEAIGKCGTQKGLQYISEMKIVNLNELQECGQAWGIARFGLRKMSSENATKKIIELLKTSKSEKCRYAASIYFTRLKDIDLTNYEKQILEIYKKESYAFTKQNLMIAIGKIKNEKIIDFIKSSINADSDYRLKINAIRALANFNYNIVKSIIAVLLLNTQTNVAIKASEYFLEQGIPADADYYNSLALQTQNFRVKANMLAAALKNSVNKQAISDSIILLCKNTKEPYQKAALITTLGNSVCNWKYVSDECFSSKIAVIKSSSIEALVNMRKLPEYSDFRKNYLKNTAVDLDTIFAKIFKKAILSDDIAMISTAAVIIREPELNYKSIYKNFIFIESTLKRLEIPRDLEAFNELKQTLKFFTGKEIPSPKIKYKAIDWNMINTIKQRQQVKIKTSKGNMVVELYVNEATASVVNFIELIKRDFYKNGHFHRVVPNFVIQDGCTRGDGWSSPALNIHSEFSVPCFEEESLGMASSGKDTEGCQWFITHSPTPHLDGGYTNFGKVVRGMDVVHLLEIGDSVLGYEILQ